jgi:hypothetical protein
MIEVADKPRQPQGEQRMPAFAITRERTRNAARREEYKKLAQPVFEQDPATLHASHRRHEVLEGCVSGCQRPGWGLLGRVVVLVLVAGSRASAEDPITP